jgi:hypothetical protein
VTVLTRYQRTDHGVFGHLRLEREIVCVTLEHPLLLIRPGGYTLGLRYSERFAMLLPGLIGVPDRTDIEMHAGNSMADTKGCILLGVYQISDREIEQSRIALGKFLSRWREWESKDFVVESEG